MNQTTHHLVNLKIDWRWVGMGYCLLVVLHLLPTLLIANFLWVDVGRETKFLTTLVWIYIGLVYVGFYVGYRSREFTVLESGLSSIFYALTLVYILPNLIQLSARAYEKKVLFIASFFVVATVGAWMGEIVQARIMQKTGKQHSTGGAVITD